MSSAKEYLQQTAVKTVQLPNYGVDISFRKLGPYDFIMAGEIPTAYIAEDTEPTDADSDRVADWNKRLLILALVDPVLVEDDTAMLADGEVYFSEFQGGFAKDIAWLSAEITAFCDLVSGDDVKPFHDGRDAETSA